MPRRRRLTAESLQLKAGEVLMRIFAFSLTSKQLPRSYGRLNCLQLFIPVATAGIDPQHS